MRLAVLALSVAAFSSETPLRILFLGNSYTYYNHLAGLVAGMAHGGGGRRVETGFVAKGGASLEGLYTGTNALEVLRGSRWDLVVLQEHSTLGLSQFNGDIVINDPAAFFAWTRIWDAEIRAQGARTVLLNTWARKGRAGQQAHLDWAYATIARELGAGLIPAGAAFAGASHLELYQADGSHPSAAGSYLAACAAVEILTAGGCAGAPEEILGVPMDNRSGRLGEARGVIVRLPPETAALLRKAALAAVEELRGQGGYWRLARPVFAGPTGSGSGLGPWQGRWEGVTWLYGKQANVTLHLEARNGACEGNWTVRAMEPATQATMPLENCTVSAERVRFVVKPLFLTVENHEVWLEGGVLRGRMTLQSISPYMRQGGNWTLHRVTP